MDVSKTTRDDYIVDVSAYQTITNYALMRGANSAGWAKATQGNYYVNKLFGTQMNGMSGAGMKAGAYHFPDPNNSIYDNVLKFLAVARNWIQPGCLIPMLDVENDSSSGIQWTELKATSFIPAFIRELRDQTGIPDLGVVVYGSGSWWGSTLHPERWGDLSHVFLMEANYNGTPGQTMFKHPRLAVHQYTNKAPTPGVAAPTDRSVIFNGYKLSDLVIGASTPEPTPVEEEEDDDMAVKPIFFQAEGYPFGAVRDEFGVYIGFANTDEQQNMLDAYGNDEARKGKDGKGVWVTKATLDEWVRISRGEPAATQKG